MSMQLGGYSSICREQLLMAYGTHGKEISLSKPILMFIGKDV